MKKILYAILIFILVIWGFHLFVSLLQQFSPQIISLRALRMHYEGKVADLKNTVEQMQAKGVDSCLIAKRVSKLRRDIARQYKEATPLYFRRLIYRRNISKYGDPLGPTYEKLRQGRYTCEQIYQSSARMGGQDLLIDIFVFDLISDVYWVCEYSHHCKMIVLPASH